MNSLVLTGGRSIMARSFGTAWLSVSRRAASGRHRPTYRRRPRPTTGSFQRCSTGSFTSAVNGSPIRHGRCRVVAIGECFTDGGGNPDTVDVTAPIVFNSVEPNV